MRTLFLAVILVAIAGHVAAQTIEVPQPATLTIRSYKHSLAEEEFRTVRDLAGAILGQAGISVSWLPCWSRDDERARLPAGCARPLAWNELIVKVVSAADANAIAHSNSLGFSLIDVTTGGGSVATVYPDRARALARDARIDGMLLVARALAHEIGHMVMGTNRHAHGGLMRAVWSRAELRRDIAGDWLFSEPEAREMRRGIEARRMVASR